MKMQRYRTAIVALLVSMVFVQCGMTQDDQEDRKLTSTVAAPPNSRELRSTPGGAFFVDKGLLERYESLKARLLQIREDISLGNASGESAMRSLASIEAESKRLRTELERKKVLVSAFRVYSKTSKQTFPLGDERLVIVTGDHVVVRGWQGPGLRCVVEKTIVAKEQPEDAEFDRIQVNHELTAAEEKVGLTREKRDQQEREFLASENGRNLTDEQRAKRQELVDQIHRSYDVYAAFQGRRANTIQLTGLTYQEGNRNLTMRIESPGGGGGVSSQWQKRATMTVYVPKCKVLALRGCLVGLDVRDIDCDLVLTTHDSKAREYEGEFTVHGVKGNVTIDQVPVHSLSQVTGDVRFSATNEFVNSGTHHQSNMRTFSPYQTHVTQVANINGDLFAKFLRTDLRLSAIRGRLDVINQYGTTRLAIDAVDTKRAHRIVSHSGSINVHGPSQVLASTPIYAHTQCGRLHTNMSRDILDDVSFSTGQPQWGWHGFVTPSKERFDFGKFDRPASALENRTRAAGLDLVSDAGTVSILADDEAS